ncbi:MAG: histidine phosphatase family protein, partial [Candidatus Fimadaptatus sp.]
MQNGKLILIRHTDFTKPVPGAYYGQTDLDLTPAGEQQARALAPLLARLAP